MARIGDLNEDLLALVLAYLAPEELARVCAPVCRFWNQVQNLDRLWKPHCSLLWSTKANMPPPPPTPTSNTVVSSMYPRALLDYSLLSREEAIGMLHGRDIINTPDELLLAALSGVSLAMLVDELRGSEALLECMPEAWRRYRCALGKWKANYVYSWLDLTKRKHHMTSQEMYAAEWAFFFKQQPRAFAAQARFTAAGELVMDPNPARDQRLRWQFVDRQSKVQVNQFPAHRISRRAHDGAFQMENMAVIFVQCNGPGFNLANERARLAVQYAEHAWNMDGEEEDDDDDEYVGVDDVEFMDDDDDDNYLLD